MIEPFLLHAFLASAGLAVLAAPLGCLVVWNRMAYFGEAIAHAGLMGVALSLAFQVDLTASVLLVALAAAVFVLALSRQRVVPIDSVLGLLHHGALSLGIIATGALSGPSVDLRSYLFGDIYAVAPSDLYWLAGTAVLVLGALVWLWQPLLRIAVHAELAAAEGVPRQRIRAAFIILMALAVAMAIKFVGILLAVAFLIVPAVAARPFATTPERMVVIALAVAVAAVAAGLYGSWTWDLPGGPSIVLAMALAAAASLVWVGSRDNG